ncbi:MAG TPA: lactaldehyde reductase [Rariglobus sp.]
MAHRIILNETSYFGPGSRSVLPAEIKRRGFKKALFVTDKELIKFGVAQKVLAVLADAGVPHVVYDDIKPNPTIANVTAGIAAYKASGADFIIAMGGGSSIDTAKAIGIVVNNPEFAAITPLEGVAPTKNRSVPIIALPTTAGTAAEVTINYVITDEKAVKKMVCVDPNDIPVLSIVDAELMLSMPKGLTAATGMDALTHAIECYLTRAAWVMSDMFALQAIRMISAHLADAVHHPASATARDGMAVAQYIAGMGFSNVGLGIVHSMAHPLGAFYDTPHGIANAVLLPYVLDYNAPACAPRFREIARAMGMAGVDALSEDAAVVAAIGSVRALSKRVGIPEKLREIGVKEADLPKLAVAAFGDVCTGGNPRTTSVADILEIYRKAF